MDTFELITFIEIHDVLVRELCFVNETTYRIYDKEGNTLFVHSTFEAAWDEYPARFSTQRDAEAARDAWSAARYPGWVANGTSYYIRKRNKNTLEWDYLSRKQAKELGLTPS